MGYNKSLGIHGIFKKERFTEEAYKALSYLKLEVREALIKDVKIKTKDTWDTGESGIIIKLEYEGPTFTPRTRSPGQVTVPRTSPVKVTYDAQEFHKANKDDLINNIANEYADKMANVWGMAITLDDDDNIVIKGMNNELWASRAELIENVQKNTRIVTIVRPWTDPTYPEGYVDLKYNGNIYRYAISFYKCEPRYTTSCWSFESEIVAKAGTHLYIISKDLFEKLGINDLIFEKGERADNIESLREVLYTLSQRPIPIPKQSQEETKWPWIIGGLVVVGVLLLLAALGYAVYQQSKKTTLVTESLDLVNVNEGILPPPIRTPPPPAARAGPVRFV